MPVPFPRHRQLCSELSIVNGPRRSLAKVLDQDHLLTSTSKTTGTENDRLPGHPWLRLQDESMTQFLLDELVPDDLNKMAPQLWLVAKQDSSHISSLTHQLVRGREIVVTEKPGLHLTWIYERVFIKPLPQYLLSHAFWDFYLSSSDSLIPEAKRQDVLKAARGFLRSYAYLVQHQSDYRLATQDNRFVPAFIPFPDLVEFLRCFKDIPDADVSPRYRFGELRLTRLNIWAKILLHRPTYFKQYGQYGAYFAQFYGPLLFAFAVMALALNSMQVVLAVESLVGVDTRWAAFASTSWGFSVFTLFAVLLLSMALSANILYLILREAIYAIRDFYRKKNLRSGCDGDKGIVASGTNRDNPGASSSV